MKTTHKRAVPKSALRKAFVYPQWPETRACGWIEIRHKDQSVRRASQSGNSCFIWNHR